jgi:hypothetical protein
VNIAYKSLFAARVAGAIGAATAVASVNHAGVKGRIREILVRDLFRPLLPYVLGLATGHIVTSENHQSPEQDVVIFDRRILPPVLFEESLGLLPIESVLATVEVKTTLTATELKDADDKAQRIRTYPYLHGIRDDETGELVSHRVEHVIPCIFALGTDLAVTGKTELQRYQELRPSGDPPIRTICVSGRGYWFFHNAQWHFVPSDAAHRETICFVSGLLGTFNRVSLTRRRPELSGYLMNESEIVRGVG